MHKRTYQIIKNLGYDEKTLNQLKKKEKINRKTFTQLKNLGLPDAALKQIKFLEDYPQYKLENKSNKELIELLIKKVNRSFDAFNKKGVEATILFKDNTWTIFSSIYSKAIEKLHIVCKVHFDEWCEAGVEVTFIFDGSDAWKITTKKE